MDDYRFTQPECHPDQVRHWATVLKSPNRIAHAGHIVFTLAVASILGTLVWPLHGSTTAAARQAAVQGSAVIHVHMSDVFSTVVTLSGASSLCQLAYFPATQGKDATAASSVLHIEHNPSGVSARPPGADAFALAMDGYTPAARNYAGSSAVLLSLVVHRHSYLFSLFDSTSIAVHTSDGGHTGSFQAIGLKPNNGTTGGKVNACGTWTCSDFQKVMVR